MLNLLGMGVHIFGCSLTTTPGGFIEDVAPRLTAYEQSATATFGYESARFTLTAADLDEAVVWAERLLCPVTVYGPDAAVCWDGFVAGVAFQAGGRARSLSLDTVANRVRVRYTLRGLGTPQVTASGSDAGSAAIYGVRDAVLGIGVTDSTGATGLRDAYLAARAYPRAVPQTTLSVPAASGPITVGVTCAGWYSTLDWVLLERTDTTTEATTTQLSSLLGSSSPGIGATNTFLSTTPRITGTGVTSPRTIPADTTYRQAIETRLALGDTGGQRFAWGVYTDRAFVCATWAGATPAAATYRTRFGTAAVENAYGGLVDPWDVRPDAIVEDADLVAVGPPSASVDTAAQFYLERVSFSAGPGGMQLTLETSEATSVDARIARMS